MLPALRLAAHGESRGTIVLHGGFDSFAEEFASAMMYLAGRGYDVVVFDGPGQGSARREHDQAFDPAWEKPTSAVLDHFDLDGVTLIGVSMGVTSTCGPPPTNPASSASSRRPSPTTTPASPIPWARRSAASS